MGRTVHTALAYTKGRKGLGNILDNDAPAQHKQISSPYGTDCVLIALLPQDVAAWLHIYSMGRQPGATQLPLNFSPKGVVDFESHLQPRP